MGVRRDEEFDVGQVVFGSDSNVNGGPFIFNDNAEDLGTIWNVAI